MASENLAKLQATVNRFASKADFSQLTIDGGMGPKTANAIITTLAWVAANIQAETDTAGALVVKLAAGDGTPDQTAIMQNVVGINTYLWGVADVNQLAPAATVALTKPSGNAGTFTPDKSAFSVKPPPGAGFAASAQLWFRQLPTWGQVALGVGGGLGFLFAATRIKKGAKR